MGHALAVSPWLGIVGELGVLAALLAVLRVYQRRGALAPEAARKLFHTCGGLTTLAVPWVFTSVWPVLTLAAIIVPALLALKHVRRLRGDLGRVLYSIERDSLGEVYLPLSVAFLWMLCRGNALLYSIPVLILSLADPAAALIGLRYGRLRYRATDGEKSAEGSVAFCVVALVVVLIPLLLFSSAGRPETLLIAVTVALLATLAEAVAARGLDNLFIPLVSYILLAHFLAMDLAQLAVQLAITVGLAGFALAWRRRTTFCGGALMGAILGGYLIWLLGGWHWLLVPFILFASYTTVLHQTELDRQRLYDVHAVLGVAWGGFAWLFLAQLFNRPDFLYPFTIAFGAHLAIVGMLRHRHADPRAPAVVLLGGGIAKGWLMLVVAYLVIDGFTLASGLHALAALGGVSLAAIAFYRTQPDATRYPIDPARWQREGLWAAAGSALGMATLALLPLAGALGL